MSYEQGMFSALVLASLQEYYNLVCNSWQS